MLQNLLIDNPGIQIGDFTITYYAICIVCGMLVAFGVITVLFKRRNMSADLFLTMFCICLPICLVTTRLFYCITDGMHISEWFSWESIRSGGLSIIGALLGGLISVFAFCMIKKVNFFRAGDCVVVGLALAQAIGRWGNFFNQEVYGMEVTDPNLQWFPIAVYIEARGAYHYAFFFYESMFNLCVAALLFWNAWKNPYRPNGINCAVYFTCYGLIRSIMEPLRDPSYILGDGVQWSLVMSLCMLVGGLCWLAAILIVNKRKYGKLIGAASGNPYAIVEYIKDTKDEIPVYSSWNMMCPLYPDNYEKPEVTAARLEKEKEEKEKAKQAFLQKIKNLFNKKDGE